MSELLLLTGPPGAGKSTVAGLLCRGWERAVHVHTDDFYAWIRSGYVEPWLPEASEQNLTLIEAMAAAAIRLLDGGYDVVVDGILGPWFLDPWRATGRPTSYAILLPTVDEAERRAAERGEHPLQDLSVVGTMHEALAAHAAEYERHVVDTTSLTPEQTVDEVRRRLDAHELLL